MNDLHVGIKQPSLAFRTSATALAAYAILGVATGVNVRGDILLMLWIFLHIAYCAILARLRTSDWLLETTLSGSLVTALGFGVLNLAKTIVQDWRYDALPVTGDGMGVVLVQCFHCGPGDVIIVMLLGAVFGFVTAPVVGYIARVIPAAFRLRGLTSG